MKYLTLAVALLLTSCINEPMSVEHTGKNDEFKVEYLFEKDGIKVYRFYDGRYHYFTTGGTTMSTYHESKQTYTEEIPRREANLPTDNN
jgi:hypothetical protein